MSSLALSASLHPDCARILEMETLDNSAFAKLHQLPVCKG
jgi:hypothetical protein